MKNKNLIWLINHFEAKRNKKIICILSISIIIVSIVFSFNLTIQKYINEGIKKQYDYNTHFIIYSPIEKLDSAKEKLKKIDHITDVYENKEYHFNLYLDKMANNNVTGSFLIYYANKEFLKRNNIESIKNNEIYCPKLFYPNDDLESANFTEKNKIINLSNIVGSDIDAHYFKTIKDKDFEERKIKLKLAGVFNNNYNYLDENVCYANKELIANIFNDSYENVDLTNQVGSLLISIDDEKNYEYVATEINKLKYEISSVYMLDNDFINFVNMLTIFILLVTIITNTLIIFLINKKQLEDKKFCFGLLKSIGFDKRTLNKLLLIECFLLIFYSFIISSISILFIYNIINIITKFYPFIFVELPITIDYKINIVSIILYFMILLINYLLFKNKIIENDILEGLREYNENDNI